MQYIYLLSSSGFFKIGVANDVSSRIASLQTGNPHPIKLISCYGFQNAEFVERALHQKYSNERLRGEWFNLSDKHIDEFEVLCSMLGGVPDGEIAEAGECEIAEAEYIQETVLDDPGTRIEPRYGPGGELYGFALRERNKGRKVVKYIGKQNNREEFEAMLERFTAPDFGTA
jgi:hypothetical protein